MKKLHLIAGTMLCVACGGPRTDNDVYLDQLEPLLVENGMLSDRVLTMAAGLYDQKLTSKQVREQWDAEVVPMAEHLHAQASVVTPPDALKDRHTELVTIWQTRARAYRSLSLSINQADTSMWTQAQQQVEKVKLDEESWFQKANSDLGPGAVGLNPYP